MPVPSPRNPIRPARGDLADLQANISDLYEGELCYALDKDSLYIKEGSSLVRVALNTNINNAQSGESLNYNGTEWVNGGVQDGGVF